MFFFSFLWCWLEEGEDEYENDGFMVDDVDEEDNADSDDERQMKKKRKKK